MQENKKLLGLGIEERQPGQRQLSSTAARVHKSSAEMSAQDERQKRAQDCDKIARRAALTIPWNVKSLRVS